MSSAPHIYLTDADVDDLRAGHMINAMDEAGNEHDLSLEASEIDALENGAELWLDHGYGPRVSYPD